MDELTIRQTIGKVRYKDWRFDVADFGDDFGALLVVRVTFDSRDAYTGIVEPQHGRRWLLGDCETEDDLLRTLLLAVLTAEEHEAREAFTYDSRRIFQPHTRKLAVAV